LSLVADSLRYNFYVQDDAPNNQWKHLVQPTNDYGIGLIN
jgi:hypothetical protein